MTFGDLARNDKEAVLTEFDIMCWHRYERPGTVKGNISKDTLSLLVENRTEERLHCSLIHKTGSDTKPCSGAMGFYYVTQDTWVAIHMQLADYTMFLLSICTPQLATGTRCSNAGPYCTGGVIGRNFTWMLWRFLLLRKYADDLCACRETAV